MKEVNSQNSWTFDSRTQDCIKIRMWIFVGFY